MSARFPSHEEKPEAVTRDAPETISNAELLETDIDVLVPAAVSDVLTAANAPDVGTRIAVEGTNGPMTVAADAVFERRDIPVVPNVLANAGGVTVSCFEWLQNINRRACPLERVNEKLE
jgi:glutamate dehydrogenase (NAD(P)+)